MWRRWPLSAVLAVAAMWGGLTLSYAAPKLPASFSIMAFAAAEFALATLISLTRTPRAAFGDGQRGRGGVSADAGECLSADPARRARVFTGARARECCGHSPN